MLSTVDPHPTPPADGTGSPDGTTLGVEPGAQPPVGSRRAKDLTPANLRLFKAAADAFSDKGFHGTTTRDIASRAGLSPAGVYVHFASKEDLLFQLSRDGHVIARDELRLAAEQADGPAAALRAVVVSFARWHAENYQVARIVQYEFRHLSEDHRAEVLTLRKEIDGVVRNVIEQGIASGEFAVDDVRLTVLSIMSMVVDVARWYHPGVRESAEQIATTYGDLAVRLVSAGTAGTARA